MKQLLFISFIFLGVNLFGQIKVIETPTTETIGKLQGIKIEKTGNIYYITYDNLKYLNITDIKSFSFEDVDNAFENLYQMIIKGFDEVPEKDIMIDLPNDIIWLHFEKNMGIVSFQFYQNVNKTDVVAYSRYLTKKQVQKLFGKA